MTQQCAGGFPGSVFTICRSSMRAFTPASISFLSCGVSGHGYKVALKLKKDEEAQVRICWTGTPDEIVRTLASPLPFTDLLDSVLQLVSLEEDDEDRLVDLVTLWEHHTVRTETGTASDQHYRKSE